ncbi:valine--tRNA ligase [Spiroplasma cantharicola]|uniref:Valine--tRNA ligase n=1 Tax=Spiroplasma cantharicola TaxID=362837 RepID=A0A0M4JWS5_9MOLU|nr:valine--tRNA ligase [Spiroplasma cantharicola]ALD66455.1 valyl-tRNA synthetase [Spiroplasma cantharicola]
MKELDKKYNHKDVEKNKYSKWLKEKIFEAEFNSKKPAYSIVIPPPNVTGKLHLGHAWDGSLQDLLIRFKKLNGFDTVWIPGMDHAGIATQAKVEERLREQGISKYDLGRDKFIAKVWEWKEEYAATIRSQWAKLGLSLDYSKEKFTYSDELNQIVNYVFVKMYEDKLIYKGKRIINWDPKQKTALSNIEVIYKETKGAMYHFKYILSDNQKDFLQVATTRPETMFGDVCLVVNPKDKRYSKYIGKTVINPSNKALIPVITDEYVEIEFGTGVMKCTPAHDPNDFEIGLKHNLEQIVVMNDDATMNDLAQEFQGLDRFEARKQLIAKLTKEGTFIKKEEIVHQVGYSERSNAIVEPFISDQWFVKMKPLAKQVLDLQKSKEAINFYPNRFNDTLNKWMENSHDWTISRQLWWGHQIPAWYHKDTKEVYVGITPPKDEQNWERDSDVLDTWFSSAFWPFATMNWNNKKQSEMMKRYFPVSTMVTGYDIIFFWVARMVFQSLEFTSSKPFKDVLIHGLIRDEQGRKMSKSLGNGVDPMDVIEKYGADSLRYFLLTNSSPGQDLRYSEEKLTSTWNFINKIWNASRYVMLNLKKIPTNLEFEKLLVKANEVNNQIDFWILNRLSETKKMVKEAIEKYEFTVAGKLLYNFIWDDYCSWYIELSKAQVGENSLLNKQEKQFSQSTLGYVLKNILIMLHPFMPFVSEEIYQSFDLQSSILKERWLDKKYQFKILTVDHIFEIVNNLREFRANQNIKNAISLNIHFNLKKSKFKSIIEKGISYINIFVEKLVNCKLDISIIDDKDLTSIAIKDYFLDISNKDFFDKDKAIQETQDKINELLLEIDRSEKMLANENFLKRAAAEKVLAEKEKYINYKKQHELLVDKLNELKKEKA